MPTPVNLDAGELHIVDGKPADQFCLASRACVPRQAIIDGTYQFPDIIPGRP